MKTIYQKKLHRAYEFPKKTVVAMGSFDGFHMGHRRLVETATQYAEKHNLISMVYTYENHPSTILSTRKNTLLLTSNEVRTQLFKDVDVDCVYFEDFSVDYADLSPTEFVNRIIIEKLNAKAVVIGFDYRFGKYGAGDAECLKKICKQNDITAICVDPVYYENEKISSTLIRKHLKEGCLDKVEAMLGRKFYIKGTVEYGKQLGGKMGFPTANIYPFKAQALPSNGVYISNVFINELSYVGVTNVGINPTVEFEKNLKVETFIIGFDGDLYGQDITVEFIKRIRDEKVFDSAEELFEQIGNDVSMARKYCNDRD